MLKLQEWLVARYRARVEREGDRDDGLSPATLAARFRNEFRGRMLTAMAKGQARMMMSAGLPSSSCKKYSSLPPKLAYPVPHEDPTPDEDDSAMDTLSDSDSDSASESAPALRTTPNDLY